MEQDIWNGYITDIDDKDIICILRKDYNCDKELIVGRDLLTKEQNDMVKVGLIMRFDLASLSGGEAQLEFMLEDGINWI